MYTHTYTYTYIHIYSLTSREYTLATRPPSFAKLLLREYRDPEFTPQTYESAWVQDPPILRFSASGV